MAATARPSGSGGSANAPLTPPDDLKMLAPFLQRAHETRKADPALSYWCGLHAVQMGIARMGSLAPSSKSFLVTLMDSLEAQKKSLAGNDIVHGDEIVAKAHIENTALKVFAGADTEDRAGKATKATARRFLVAGNFIEVLTNFGSLDADMEKKLKYAKWKAADIARALREGKRPTPGPAGGLADDSMAGEGTAEAGGAQEALSGLDDAGARLGGLMAETGPLPSKEELDAEMARITADSTGSVPGTPRDDFSGLAISPSAEHMRPAAQPTRISFDARSDGSQRGADPITTRQSPDGVRPNFSKPMRMSSYLGSDHEVTAEPHQPDAAVVSTYPADDGVTGMPTPSNSHFLQQPDIVPREGIAGSPRPPLPHPPSSSSVQASGSRSPLPLPPQAQFGHGPAALSPQPSQPPHSAASTQFQPTAPPSFSDDASVGVPAAQRGVPAFQVAPSAPISRPNVPSAPPVPAANLPVTLEASQTARVQKLAKWAVSALDYDDVETARKQLREALDICEGRSHVLNGLSR